MFNLIPWKRKRKEGNGKEVAKRESSPLGRLRDEVDSLFDQFFRDGPDFGRLWKGWPALVREGHAPGWGFEVDDKEDEIFVRAEAPGFAPGDFDIQVSGNRLVMRAEHKSESKEKGRFSYSYGSLYRVIPLPEGIEEDKIEARYRRGVLEVNVPKGDRAKGSRITVKGV